MRNLFGPELCWILLYAATVLLGSSNQPPTVEGNQRLELIGWLLPLIGVAASLVTLAWLRATWWALARVLLAGTVGAPVVITTLCGAIRYDDSRDSGVGTAWMVFIMLGWVALAGALVIAAGVVGLTHSRRSTAAGQPATTLPDA
jgi:hypothetical protein